MTNADAAPINGAVNRGFEPVEEAFRDNFATRGELGAALTVVVRGETMVDLWGGWAEPAGAQPWEQRTLSNIWAAGNGLAAVCVLQLVESRDIDLDAPVTRYWPEFGAAGKSDIPVRWLLSHRSGLTGIEPERPLTLDNLLDWSTMVRLLAAQGAFFPPGSTSGYQALSFGYLLGEIVRRTTGQTLGEFLFANVSGPLNADVHIGLTRTDTTRCATTVEADRDALEAMSFPLHRRAAAAALQNPAVPGRHANDLSWRLAQIPSANAHATAHGLATVYGALADGSERLLRGDTIELGRTSQGWCVDAVVGVSNEFGLGFTLGSTQHSFGPNPFAFGHDGAGGTTGFADPENGVGFGYVMNRMGPGLRDDPRKMALVAATYACLGGNPTRVRPGQPVELLPTTQHG